VNNLPVDHNKASVITPATIKRKAAILWDLFIFFS
jgi:hypothetical protein